MSRYPFLGRLLPLVLIAAMVPTFTSNVVGSVSADVGCQCCDDCVCVLSVASTAGGNCSVTLTTSCSGQNCEGFHVVHCSGRARVSTDCCSLCYRPLEGACWSDVSGCDDPDVMEEEC
jgi:hypothetical protein